MEGAEEEGFRFLVFVGVLWGREFIISNVETGPVHWCGEDGVGVPEEGGDICEIAVVVRRLGVRVAYVNGRCHPT